MRKLDANKLLALVRNLCSKENNSYLALFLLDTILDPSARCSKDWLNHHTAQSRQLRYPIGESVLDLRLLFDCYNDVGISRNPLRSFLKRWLEIHRKKVEDLCSAEEGWLHTSSIDEFVRDFGYFTSESGAWTSWDAMKSITIKSEAPIWARDGDVYTVIVMNDGQITVKRTKY